MLEIRVDDLSDPRVAQFLDEHIQDMRSVSPPESKHALDLDGLKHPTVTFWSVWKGGELIACGALKQLTKRHAEIKSMRVSPARRGQGVAAILLKHIVNDAASRGYHCLSLETGSMAFFVPARRLYESFGFDYCPPFAAYTGDPNSVFMSLELQ